MLATLDEKLMGKIDLYMQEQKYRVAKPFYDGLVQIPGSSPKWTINKQSMKLLINALSAENTVDLYVIFVKAVNDIEANEAAAALEAEKQKAAIEASKATTEAAPADENNIVPMVTEGSADAATIPAEATTAATAVAV
jgi:hypothetical protein